MKKLEKFIIFFSKACWKGSKNIVDLLLKHKADVNAVTNDNNTPLLLGKFLSNF